VWSPPQPALSAIFVLDLSKIERSGRGHSGARTSGVAVNALVVGA
jgi:hypothetical protein